MNGPHGVDSWQPAYPPAKDERVAFSVFELQTFLSDRRPGVTVCETPVESPACFWIDASHVYLRANWSQWFAVSHDSPDHVAAICNARYCRVTSSMNNVIQDTTAPVYRVAELPLDVIAPSDESKADVLGPEESLESVRRRSEYDACIQKVLDAVTTRSPGLSVFPRVTIEGDQVAAAISNERLAVLLDILPENRDFSFAPDTGENRHNPMNDWTSDVITLDFVSKLRRLQAFLKRNEPESGVIIGLVANSKTLEGLLVFADTLDLDDFEMTTYEEVADDIARLFAEH